MVEEEEEEEQDGRPGSFQNGESYCDVTSTHFGKVHPSIQNEVWRLTPSDCDFLKERQSVCVCASLLS